MNKTQAYGSFMEICPFGQYHMLETSWAWMEIFPAACDQMPQEVLCDDDGSPNDDNDTGDECNTPSTMFNEMF